MIKISDKILSWCENPEQGAIEQALKIEKHPCLIGNVLLMPDTHQGYGMPIGGVVALKNAISPNMVGVDIGCGMLAVKTSLTEITTEQLKSLLGGSKENPGGIRANIPVGMKHHKKEQYDEIFNSERWEQTIICKQEKKSASHQLGTLGGGNHFIEIQKGNDGYIWFMIHSGSRNLGYKVAKFYNEIAKELNLQYKQEELVKNDLAFLPSKSNEFDLYLTEMQLCLDFAFANRKLMSEIIKKEFYQIFNNIEFLNEINIHHNYVALENHYGINVWVHRKGATLARENTIGIIPGSQGSCSYIVQGLGNEASLCSCSHGAGRKMSRNKAIETLSLETEKKLMDEKGILHGIRGKNNLDEAPGAYKNIDVVMKEQKDLVAILVKLEPLAVIKE